VDGSAQVGVLEETDQAGTSAASWSAMTAEGLGLGQSLESPGAISRALEELPDEELRALLFPHAQRKSQWKNSGEECLRDK
jgi:hypothetical protein